MKIKKDSRNRNLQPGEDQMQNGRYRYRFTDKNGLRQQIYAWKLVPSDRTPKGKKEDLSLREKEQLALQDDKDGINTKAGEMTVIALINKYLDSKPHLADTTLNNYKRMLEWNIEPNKLGKMNIKDVKKSDILMFYKYLYQKKNYSDGTIQLYQNLIYPAFQMAVEDDSIRKNPCAGCMKDYNPNGIQSDKIPLTREETAELFEFLASDTYYGHALYLVAFILGTGCRIGEALGMTWNDIHLDEKYVDVNHQMIYKEKVRGEKMRYYITEPKHGSSRKIPIQDDLVSLLKRYKQETYFLSKSSGFEVDGLSEFVFINKNLRVVTPGTFNRTLHGIAKGISKNRRAENDTAPAFPIFSAHILRHTYCTRMAENGCDVKVLQELMGHKNIQVTMQVYNHATFERNFTEVEKIPSVTELEAVTQIS